VSHGAAVKVPGEAVNGGQSRGVVNDRFIQFLAKIGPFAREQLQVGFLLPYPGEHLLYKIPVFFGRIYAPCGVAVRLVL
jgi:hypothetical protein